jgi:ankyrin repeat protein
MKINRFKLANISFWLCCLCGTAVSQIGPPTQALRAAVRDGNVAELKVLLRKGAHLNAKDAESLPLLLEAVLNSNTACVQYLLEQGADPNITDRAGTTALMLATGDPAKLELLLEHGAQVNAVNAAGRSALLLAAGQRRAVPVIKMLLDKGAQVQQQDERGYTPLLLAARQGDVETLRLLLARGADTQVRVKNGIVPPETGANALDLACYSQQAEAVKLLLDRGVSLDRGGRPLLFAAMNGSVDIVRLLLAADAPVNVTDPGGFTPLMHATLTENGKLELLKLLLAHGADPQAKAKNGSTALTYAKRKNWQDAITLLREAGADE